MSIESNLKKLLKGGVEPGIPKGAVDECQAKRKTDPTCPVFQWNVAVMVR